MNRFSLTHVPDSALLRELHTLVAQDRATTATLLAHLAEVDARRLYAAAGYPSLFAWCVEVLHLSEDAAAKRIRAARTARQFPVVFTMLADGRLHLSAVVMLAAAVHRSKAGIEQLLAERFPRPDLPERIEGLALAPKVVPSAQGPVGTTGSQQAPGPVGAPVRSSVAPLSPGRYGLQLTVAQGTYEKLRYAQALLGHAVPSGELAQVLDRALDALIARLERRKIAATTRPRTQRQSVNANARHVPAEVRRAVWQRDGGRCTFVSDSGQRCTARTRLEYDHAEPVAQGGKATARNLRLRCRAHNQHAAECAFGAGFMSHKREAAQRDLEAARSRAAESLRALDSLPAER